MRNTIILILSLIIISCSAGVETTKTDVSILFYEKPKDWEDVAKREEVIEKYSEYLSGKKFFIDPGHGGEDRKNNSYDSLLVEADLNLNVALALRDYLEAAGAEVIMSRDSDKTVDLKLRSKLANESGADFFISIHHNAPGRKENTWTDYTATFYHAKPGYFEYEPFNHDLARYVQRDLAYVMRNSGGLGSFDGTYSDYIIYPDAGFSVLRETEIPAILVECAFYTNRFEKNRLVKKEFNQIQAWGIFRGLGKFFATGFPEIKLIKEQCSLEDDELHLELEIKDEHGINPSSIEAYFDSVLVKNNFNFNEGKLIIELKDIPSGDHELRINCANVLGVHSMPYYSKIITE